jgi:hypothetical protein
MHATTAAKITPNEDRTSSSRSHSAHFCRYFFLAVFTSELIVKVIALGLYEGHDAYLASPWNRLDAFVVVTAYLIFVPGVGNMSAIRALRVLRALRTISFAPGLQRMVDALIVCVMGIASVMALTVSIVFVFAILGLQLFMGVLRQKCVSLPPTGVSDAVWQAWVSDESNYVLNDGAFSVCGNASTALGCPSVEDLVTGASEIADAAGSAYTFNGVACLNQGDNPNFGFSSFDNIGWAMVSMFQVITLDFWEDVYNNVIYATGAPAVVFFILGVFIGAFFVFNLVLAVVAVKWVSSFSNIGFTLCFLTRNVAHSTRPLLLLLLLLRKALPLSVC